MSKFENIINESINEAVKETIAEMDIESIVKESISESCPAPYSLYEDEEQKKRIRKLSNTIYDIFVSETSTVKEMHLALNEVHELIAERAKAVSILF